MNLVALSGAPCFTMPSIAVVLLTSCCILPAHKNLHIFALFVL